MVLVDIYCLGMCLWFVANGGPSKTWEVGQDYQPIKGFLGMFIGCCIRAKGY